MCPQGNFSIAKALSDPRCLTITSNESFPQFHRNAEKFQIFIVVVLTDRVEVKGDRLATTVLSGQKVALLAGTALFAVAPGPLLSWPVFLNTISDRPQTLFEIDNCLVQSDLCPLFFLLLQYNPLTTHRLKLVFPHLCSRGRWNVIFFVVDSLKANTEGKPDTIYDKRDDASSRRARGKRLYKYPVCLISSFFFLCALKYSENSQ